jgi:dihydroorotate dehydrogenase electron transfer subunit
VSTAARRLDADVRANDAEPGGYRLVLGVGADWPDAQPGQFVMLHLGDAAPRFDPLLPRPMAIYRQRPDGGELEIVYKVVGRGTALLAARRAGDRVGVVGPLGRGFAPPAAGERALLVGGGTGVASLYELARRAGAAARPVVCLGARTAGDLLGRADFDALDVDLRLATDDGSAGRRGLVTEILADALAEGGVARVVACGPTPMMQRAAALAAAAGVACELSLENRMACGFGVCLGCAVPRAGEGFHLVCRDGPVFDAAALALEALP